MPSKSSPPRFIPPMLLQLVHALPEGEHWRYEVKWDGYRIIAVVERGKARLWSRNERDLDALNLGPYSLTMRIILSHPEGLQSITNSADAGIRAAHATICSRYGFVAVAPQRGSPS